ncbi:MAG: FAD-dependent oxidoreductase [Gammaproteobacteria bacterium]|nr:FAD-dependent oxidoreductase [Gammaproteobacteria bacterium]
MRSLAIIGAGIAGITLARQLQGRAEVTVFEKSRDFGGRMATYKTGPYQFDHGAQFFTARSMQFQSLISNCVAENKIQSWLPRILTLDSEKKSFKREWSEPHYIAAPCMNSLCKTLALGLNVKLDTEVTGIDALEQGWLLRGSAEKPLGHFDWVASTLPAPQANELLPDCFIYKSELSAVDFSPCFSLMLGFESTHKLNFDAAVVKNSALSWIAANSSKQGRPHSFSLMVHSNNAWARTQLENNIDDVRHSMLDALGELVGYSLPLPEHSAIHRWKYARAETSCEESFLLDEANRLAACGDWCAGNRVEDAYLSGLKLGEQLQTLWRCET